VIADEAENAAAIGLAGELQVEVRHADPEQAGDHTVDPLLDLNQSRNVNA
jgi:hypothetical protein